MESDLRKSKLSEANRPAGLVFSFLPAHVGSRAGAVAEQLSRTLTEGLGSAVLLVDFQTYGYPLWQLDGAPRRFDRRSGGAFVREHDGIDVLNAPDTGVQELAALLHEAREKYTICADLSEARAVQVSELVRLSESIFLVAGTSRASLEAAREKIEWLQSIDLEERCGLLLHRDSAGLTASEAEEITGLPVCSLVDTKDQIARVAQWIAANAVEPKSLALAG